MTDHSHETLLVTGGAGFIGCAASAGFADAFGRVLAVDSMHPQIHPTPDRPAGLDPRVELVVGDISQPATWDRVLADIRPDVVVHLAAETGTGQSLEVGSRHAVANVVGTTRMLDAFASRGEFPRRIVLSSSRAVYGEGSWRRADGTVYSPGQRTAGILAAHQWDFPGAEPIAMSADTTPPAPVSIYGVTKLTQEGLLNVWAKSYGVEPFIVRLQNVYGPGQSLINPYTGIMSLFCRMAMGGGSIPLYEDGAVRRDFVLIGDVARAIVMAATTQRPAPARPLDIGSGEMQTILTAAELIAAEYGAPAPHVTGQYRQGDVRHAWADVTAARLDLGWVPEYGLARGVHELATWINAQPDVQPVVGQTPGA